MSQKQLKTFKVISSFIEGIIGRDEAAQLLSLSPRQISRIKRGVLESGAEALLHKNAGRKPAHTLSEDIRRKILLIHERDEFRCVNFSHFRSILRTHYAIDISYSALYRLLKRAGIDTPKKKKTVSRKHRRKRMPHPGQLIQIDASPYEWLGGKIKYALHGAIDDATGEIVGLYLTQNECLFGYFSVMRQCCIDFGVPQTIYSDKHTIFRSPKASSLTVEEIIDGKSAKLTQFGRAMHELGTDMIFAGSPQAKGRIERLWGTLQSRLPVEFAMNGIKTVSQANEFLKDYKERYNAEFAVKAPDTPLFVTLRDGFDIDSVLCIKHTRKTDNAGTFSFKGRSFQILDGGFPIINAHKEIQVLILPQSGIRVEYHGRIYNTIRYIKPKNEPKRRTSKNASSVVQPHLKYGSDEWKKIWWYEDYDQTLKFLYELFFEKQQSSRSA